MGSLSLFQWLIVAIVEACWIVPLWKLFKRLGFQGEWALFVLFPPAALLLLWLVAFRRWPIPDAFERPDEIVRS